MKKYVISFAAISLPATSVSPQARAATNTFSTTRAREMVAVTSPAISPDGIRAVVVVSRVNWKENKYERDLDLFDLATHAHRTLS